MAKATKSKPSNSKKAETSPAVSKEDKKADKKETVNSAKNANARKKNASDSSHTKNPAKKPARKKTAKQKAVSSSARKKTTSRNSATKKQKTPSQKASKAANDHVDHVTQSAQDAASIINQTMETFMTSNAHIDQFSKDALLSVKEGSEAFVKAGSLTMKGFETYLKTVSDLFQDTTEKHSEAVKDFMKCKTLNELTEKQNDLAQQAFDEMITNTAKLSELSVKICSDTLEPLNEHFTKTYKKVSSSLAA